MIVQPARVIAETEHHYLLETLPKSACPRCAEGKGCGGGILAQAFANKTYQVTINKEAINKEAINKQTKLENLQLVQIGIQSALLVRASLILYLVPILVMVTMTILMGKFIGTEDIYTVAAAIVGFTSGALLAKKLSNKIIKGAISEPILIESDENDCWYQAE